MVFLGVTMLILGLEVSLPVPVVGGFTPVVPVVGGGVALPLPLWALELLYVVNKRVAVNKTRKYFFIIKIIIPLQK
jgi:hypothetical protein